MRLYLIHHILQISHLVVIIFFFKQVNTSLWQKILCSKGEVEITFKDFLAATLFDISRPSINNRYQKHIDVDGSYFDWLERCLNSFI